VTFAVLCAVGAVGVAQPRDVEVRASLDRTAVWVADKVTYTVTLAFGKGVDILADDLAKDKLHLDGLEVERSDSERSVDRDDKTTYTFRYVLTTHRVDVPELKIAPLTVRYYVKRPGQRLGDAAPAGEVVVPAAVVAFRSALPDGQETYEIRDGRGARPRPMRYGLLQPVGIGLALIAIVPAALAIVAVVHRRAAPRPKRSARQMRHEEHASLEALEAMDVSSPAGRREAFDRMNTLVRDHLQQVASVGAAGLTPSEIEAALSSRPARIPLELVRDVLSTCDVARYAPPDLLPSVDECRTMIERVTRVVTS
jgi:hypothetical protein